MHTAEGDQRLAANALSIARARAMSEAMVTTDDAGKQLITCNYASGASSASGYDVDKNPLATRTLTTGALRG